MTFKPSKYQQGVYDFMQDGTGNGVVQAVAGSGKTTTIIQALKLIPNDKQALFLAFNREIMTEIKDRVPVEKQHCTRVSTVHSMGFSVLREKYPRIKIEGSKYNKMVREYLEANPPAVDEDLLPEYSKNVTTIIDLARLNYSSSISEIQALCEKYDVQLLNGEINIALSMIEKGNKNTKEIDFVDMIYMPLEKGLSFPKFDWVFVDECQDLSACQRMVMQECVADNGRFLAVGDKYQAIYGFAGADSESYDKLVELPNTIQLPLSVCYRCGSDIIGLAKEIVPEIEAFEGADTGTIENNASYKSIEDGDMVLCRNTYPLVRMCMMFLASGVKAHIKGRDIAKGLIKLVEETKTPSVMVMKRKLEDKKKKLVARIMKKEGLTIEEAMGKSTYGMFSEQVQVINVLADGLDKTKDVSIKLENLFSDDDKEGIQLSTIHRSKGLEAKRVYIIHRELMPSKFAKEEWQMVQERNLIYVAYTRAKKHLGFVTDFDAYGELPINEKNGKKADKPAPRPIQESLSDYVGREGDTITVDASIDNVEEGIGKFGKFYTYTMTDDKGNKFIKLGKLSVNEGDKAKISLVIRAHKERDGEKVNEVGQIIKIQR